MRLCFITNRRLYAGDDRVALDLLLAAIAAAANAGVDLIQIREHDLNDRQLLRLVDAALGRCSGTATRVLVNDRADIAIAAGAHGVHLRGDSFAAPRVRALAPSMIIGRSVHTITEAVAAETEGGCDYLIAGTVFATPSKPHSHPLLGIDGLRRLCAAVTLPVFAVGGMTIDCAGEVADAGATGIAGMRLFADSSKVADTVAALRAADHADDAE